MRTQVINGVSVKSNDINRAILEAPDIISHYTEILGEGRELILMYRKTDGQEYLEISFY